MNHTSVLWDLIYSEQIKCTEEALHCVQKERPFSLCTCKLSRVTLQRFDVWKIVQWMLLLFFCRWRPERRSWRSQTKSNLLLVRSRFHFKDIANFLSEILTYFNIQPVEDTEKKIVDLKPGAADFFLSSWKAVLGQTRIYIYIYIKCRFLMLNDLICIFWCKCVFFPAEDVNCFVWWLLFYLV